MTEEKRPSPRRKAFRRRGCLAAIALAGLAMVALALLDAWLWRRAAQSRAYGIAPMAVTERSLYEWNDNLSDPLLYRVDPTLSWGLRPKAKLRLEYVAHDGTKTGFDVSISKRGRRGAGVPVRKEDGVVRVFCLGDSRTFGLGVDDEQPYAAKLGPALSQRLRGRRAEAVNAGAPGYSSFQGALLAEQLMRFQPDVLTFCFGTNDFTLRTVPDREVHARTIHWLATVRQCLDRSMLYLHFRWAVLALARPRQRAGAESPPRPRVSADEYVQNMDRAFRLCRSKGALPVVVCIPVLDRGQIQAAPYRQIARRVAAAQGVPVVDMMSLIEKNRWSPSELYLDGGYLNARGHKLLAEELATVIAKGVVQ